MPASATAIKYVEDGFALRMLPKNPVREHPARLVIVSNEPLFFSFSINFRRGVIFGLKPESRDSVRKVVSGPK